jgi:hypothetical protein
MEDWRGNTAHLDMIVDCARSLAAREAQKPAFWETIHHTNWEEVCEALAHEITFHVEDIVLADGYADRWVDSLLRVPAARGNRDEMDKDLDLLLLQRSRLAQRASRCDSEEDHSAYRNLQLKVETAVEAFLDKYNKEK